MELFSTHYYNEGIRKVNPFNKQKLNFNLKRCLERNLLMILFKNHFQEITYYYRRLRFQQDNKLRKVPSFNGKYEITKNILFYEITYNLQKIYYFMEVNKCKW